MKKNHFLSSWILLILFIFPQQLYAHTINQHLEELYGETYLPFFIVAKLLPFLALGFLAYNTKFKEKPFQVRWLFIFGIAGGVILGFIYQGSFTPFLFNKIIIVVVGIALLFLHDTSHSIFNGIFLITGITLGYEDGIYMAHAHEYQWLYGLILLACLFPFLILTNLQFVGNSKRKGFLYGTGVLFILCGIIIVLLT